MSRIPCLSICALLLAAAANATILYSVQTTGGSNDATLGGQPNPDQIIAVGWTDSSAETNVEILATVGQYTGTSITAYLTDQIGTGTTTANQIATVTFTPSTDMEQDVLFSGLSLAAGSYDLVLIGNGTGEELWWANSDSGTLTEASTVTGAYQGVVNVIPGNSHGTAAAYAPASTFFDTSSEVPDFGFELTVETTPEPGSFVLLGTALIAVGLQRKRAGPVDQARHSC